MIRPELEIVEIVDVITTSATETTKSKPGFTTKDDEF